MEIGVTFLIIGVLIASIWIIIEIKRLKHKLFAIFLIALILFAYLSFTFVIKGENLNLTSISGITTASKIYMSWLGSALGNVKSITVYTIDQNWKGDKNETSKE
ncbi:MAG: hypothetical protein KKF67_03720 [Nanoarchaeota archaeon]|nr:hypothetical protein [Nanoarchaeota archaeon]